jgi:hypothetical protein
VRLASVSFFRNRADAWGNGSLKEAEETKAQTEHIQKVITELKSKEARSREDNGTGYSLKKGAISEAMDLDEPGNTKGCVCGALSLSIPTERHFDIPW